MIQLEISGVHFDLNPKIKKYIGKKIGQLDRFLPKEMQEPVHGRVVLIEEDGKSKNRFTCEVKISVPGKVLTAQEATVNIYAAVDIAEAKIKEQLLKHKEKVTDHYGARERKLWRRLRRLGRRTQVS